MSALPGSHPDPSSSITASRSGLALRPYRNRLFALFLGLSLLANLAAAGLEWHHLHPKPAPPRQARDLEAYDLVVYDDRTARFQRLSAAKCGLLLLGDSSHFPRSRSRG
jgi:hypothetical protein